MVFMVPTRMNFLVSFLSKNTMPIVSCGVGKGISTLGLKFAVCGRYQVYERLGCMMVLELWIFIILVRIELMELAKFLGFSILVDWNKISHLYFHMYQGICVYK